MKKNKSFEEYLEKEREPLENPLMASLCEIFDDIATNQNEQITKNKAIAIMLKRITARQNEIMEKIDKIYKIAKIDDIEEIERIEAKKCKHGAYDETLCSKCIKTGFHSNH